MADEQTQGNGETPPTGETPTFEQWLEEQDDTALSLIDSHTQGLRSALDSEREQRKSLARELKTISGKLDANSDAAKEVETLRGKLEAESARVEFYEEATQAGCRNLKLAWLAASSENLTIRQVQGQYPELFARQTAPSSNAGNGAGTPPGPARDLNLYIRQAAGKG